MVEAQDPCCGYHYMLSTGVAPASEYPGKKLIPAKTRVRF